ncbi:MAG: site-specific integrase, partial [Pseudonocardiaceae bacterium]
MANRKGRRRFGWVRKLPSGRYQASYLGPDGQRRHAPETFERKGDADRWLSVVESEVLRGEWTDPLLGRMSLAEFGERWITEHRLGERTREEYLSLWRNHVV